MTRALIQRAVGILVVAMLLVAGGCSPDPPPVPAEPFGEFAVGEFGGVDGRQNILRVRPDGNALLISRQPAAGRLSGEAMGRLRTLLTSEQFRQEVAREAEWNAKPKTWVCSDQIITEVRMGALSMSRSGPCGGEDLPPAPAFTEILTIVGSARRGDFAGPVDADQPRLVPVRLERLDGTGEPGYVIVVDSLGRGSIRVPGQAARTGALEPGERDILRLLIPQLTSSPVTPCQSTEHYRLRVDGPVPVSGSDCQFHGRYPEFRALVTVLESSFRAA